MFHFVQAKELMSVMKYVLKIDEWVTLKNYVRKKSECMLDIAAA